MADNGRQRQDVIAPAVHAERARIRAPARASSWTTVVTKSLSGDNVFMQTDHARIGRRRSCAKACSDLLEEEKEKKLQLPDQARNIIL